LKHHIPKVFVLLIAFLITKKAYSQEGYLSTLSFTKADSLVKTYPNHLTSIDNLAYRIQNDFTSQQEQLRAAFTWIATHIMYDLNDYYSLRPPKRIYYTSKEERRRKLKKAQDQLAATTLTTKKGLCESYASMAKVLCNRLKFPAVIINGYTKMDTRLIGTTPGIKNHAWNAVYLNERGHLLDATWAAGDETEYRKTWSFRFNDHYFLEDPSHFITHHFPEDPNWQLLEVPVSKAVFFKTPIFYEAYYEMDVTLSASHNGTLILNPKTRTLFVYFDSKPDSPLFFLTHSTIEPTKIKLKKTNSGYVGKCKIKDPNPRFLTIFKDQKAILDFKIEIQQN
jgi:transglutaminase/protease-like cytokinesis protein 3